MFKYSIDNKKEIQDRNGNTIVDLTTSIFSRNAGQVHDYEVVRMDKMFHMRPDLVSQAAYETDEYTEFILKFSGISNPFTLDDDDVLMIPNDQQMIGMMAYNNDDNNADNRNGVEAQIRNYFKFVNQEYKPDKTSYDNLKNMDIKSGIINREDLDGSYMVPYISEDGRTAVTIRNGKMYFGEDSGIQSANTAARTADDVNRSVQTILNQAMTSLSESNCIYNGTDLIDFTRATVNKNRNT